MDLRDLLDVAAICEAGSFRKAAEVLGVTQPTLSNRVAYLEDKLGVRLFERAHGRSRPTSLAELIAVRAAAIGREATLLAKEISRLASGQAGLVRIGLGPAPARALLGTLIDLISPRFPGVALEVMIDSTNRLAEQLLHRDLDIVVCHPIEGAAAAIAMEPPLEVENIIVAHPDHSMFASPGLTIGELVRTCPIAIPFLEQRYRDMLIQQYDLDLDMLQGRLMCSDFGLLVRLVLSGPRYFTAGPAFAFAAELAAGQLRAFGTPVPFKHKVAIHTNRDAQPFPAVASVMQIVRQALPEILA